MDVIAVQCPWCREEAEVYPSPEDEGVMVEDCQVCCRPWRVTIRRGEDAAGPQVQVERG